MTLPNDLQLDMSSGGMFIDSASKVFEQKGSDSTIGSPSRLTMRQAL